MRDHDPPARLRLAWAGLRGRCPRCVSGKAIVGLLRVPAHCDVCGLDYGFADSGDGPAVFVTLIAGFLILGAALWLEIAYDPPIWVYVVVFLPLTLAVCLGLLRPLKGLLIALQYRLKAEQGRLEGSAPER